MKHPLIRLALLATILSTGLTTAWADVTGVRITDGEDTVSFSFDSKPTVNFESDVIVISAEDNRVEYPMTSNVTFDFVDLSGVENQASDETRFYFHDGRIEFSRLTAGSYVSLYSMNGQLVWEGMVGTDGLCTVRTMSLPKGAAIVKTNKTAYKILIK